MRTRIYPSDMADEQWDLIGHLLPAEKPGDARGRPRSYSNRELLDAIFYHEKVGGPWRYLPQDYPQWNSVYAYFRRWSEDGTLERIHDHLRRQVRLKVGKSPEPSVLIFDSQSVKSTEKGGTVAGRTRGLSREHRI